MRRQSRNSVVGEEWEPLRRPTDCSGVSFWLGLPCRPGHPPLPARGGRPPEHGATAKTSGHGYAPPARTPPHSHFVACSLFGARGTLAAWIQVLDAESEAGRPWRSRPPPRGEAERAEPAVAGEPAERGWGGNWQAKPAGTPAELLHGSECCRRVTVYTTSYAARVG